MRKDSFLQAKHFVLGHCLAWTKARQLLNSSLKIAKKPWAIHLLKASFWFGIATLHDFGTQ